MALILRDPLERTISGFNSRLRQGRPTYTSLWKPAEAVVFAHFPDVRRYLDALIADDDWSLSACAYARRHVSHLRWNYRYYFRSPEAVREQRRADRPRRPDRGRPTPSSTRCSPRPASRPRALRRALRAPARGARSGPRGCSPATATATSRGCAPASPTNTRSTTRSSPSGGSRAAPTRRPEPSGTAHARDADPPPRPAQDRDHRAAGLPRRRDARRSPRTASPARGSPGCART